MSGYPIPQNSFPMNMQQQQIPIQQPQAHPTATPAIPGLTPADQRMWQQMEHQRRVQMGGGDGMALAQPNVSFLSSFPSTKRLSLFSLLYSELWPAGLYDGQTPDALRHFLPHIYHFGAYALYNTHAFLGAFSFAFARRPLCLLSSTPPHHSCLRVPPFKSADSSSLILCFLSF